MEMIVAARGGGGKDVGDGKAVEVVLGKAVMAVLGTGSSAA